MTDHDDGRLPAGDGEVAGSATTAFQFTGTWQEYLPIALTNLLLTVVTLGIYRFWAKARERRYLWSRTHFADDTLEWTGTGLEMFIGFLIVMAFLIPLLLFFQFGVQAAILRGEWQFAVIGILIFYVGLLYLYGLAIFRALRYRLSRTYWHGIRGGSDDNGFGYAGSSLWKSLLAILTLGLMTPWAMTRLWNERWNKMSFGPHQFHAAVSLKGLMRRWLFIYAVPIGGFLLIMVLGGAAALLGGLDPGGGGFVILSLGAGAIYLLLLFATLIYYAKFYRQAIGATRLGPVDLAFTASSKDWLKLILGTIGLVIVTLGVGLLFVAYRNWSFFIRHLEAYGEIDLDQVSQSTARGATDAEGLASAFDIGAI